jgi:uncharacterized protein
MQFGGHYRIDAPRRAVWEALNDANVLGAAIPGCQRLVWVGENALELELKVNLGVIKPNFVGDLVLSNVVPGEHYTLSGRGRGGWMGKLEGSADIVLADFGPDTELRFVAQGGASDQIMKFGKALIGSTAQKVIDGFFQRFGAAMGANVTPLTPPVEPS